MSGRRLVAVVPVRDGELPIGGSEAVAAAGGHAVVVGEGAAVAAAALHGVGHRLLVWDTPGFRPDAWARTLTPHLAGADVVILPGGPDGRDLAPRLAAAAGRPLLSGAVRLSESGAEVAHYDQRVVDELVVDGPFVVTLLAGVPGPEPDPTAAPPTIEHLRPETDAGAGAVVTDEPGAGVPAADAEPVAVLDADPETMDLAEAERIVAGGAGLGGAEAFARLAAVGTALGAAMGATRVVSDWGWVPFERQIGTTGAMVHPRLYLALGISGATQHTAGLGQPDHVISVNTDRSCPMMAMAELAVVCDAPALLAALARRLGVEAP